MRFLLELTLAACFFASSAGTYAGLQEGLDAYRGGKYRIALKELTPFANKGDAAAQFTLGVMSNFGKGVAQDHSKAFFWYRRAAEQDYVAAQYNLGVMYSLGKGVPQDSRLAAEWYRKAEEGARQEAATSAAEQAEMEQAKTEAVAAQQVLLEARNALDQVKQADRDPQHQKMNMEQTFRVAEAGDADAQNIIGMMYDQGNGVLLDYSQAMKWYQKAARQGNANALFNLGMMNDMGHGVPVNYTKALSRFRDAAERGNVEAQFKLGAMYEFGQGVPQDYGPSAEWYRKAAQQAGVEAAATVLARLELEARAVVKAAELAQLKAEVEAAQQARAMIENQIAEQASAEADKIAQQEAAIMAVEQARQETQTRIRIAEERRIRAEEAARALAAEDRQIVAFEEARIKAEEDARIAAANAAEQAKVKTPIDAVEQLVKIEVSPLDRLDAEQSDDIYLKLEWRLGKADEAGGMRQDDADRADLFRKSAALGNAEAQRQLGEMYADGLGVELDLVCAYKLLTLAALAGNEIARQGMKQVEYKMSRKQLEEARKLARERMEIYK